MAALRMANVRHILQRWRKHAGLKGARAVRRAHLRRGKPLHPMGFSSTRVFRPSEFGNVFHSGERVLELHFYSTTPTGMRSALREAKGNIPAWKSAGFAGVYGDTPTPGLIGYWKRLGAVIENCPPAEEAIARQHYAYGITHFGFPPEFLNKPFQRIIFRFT